VTQPSIIRHTRRVTLERVRVNSREVKSLA
jgi:hypothetical protein